MKLFCMFILLIGLGACNGRFNFKEIKLPFNHDAVVHCGLSPNSTPVQLIFKFRFVLSKRNNSIQFQFGTAVQHIEKIIFNGYVTMAANMEAGPPFPEKFVFTQSRYKFGENKLEIHFKDSPAAYKSRKPHCFVSSTFTGN